MRYAPVTGPALAHPIAQWFVPDTTQRQQLGLKVEAVDPYFGAGTFVYGKATTAILAAGSLATQVAGLSCWEATPNTANLGQNCGVCFAPIPINGYGWIQTAGTAIVKSTATVAALAAVGLTGAGTIGANTAGKQILGYTQKIAQTGTLAKTNVETKNGSAALRCPGGYDGWFLGAALSGTGIPASTVVAALDPDGVTVYTGSAIGTVGDKNSTASGAVTVTATFTGYSVAAIESPHVQGAIT